MYTSGRTVKSPVKRVSPIIKATREARVIVDKVMPGAGATVESRTSFDLAADTPIVITTITFPRDHENAAALQVALEAQPGIPALSTVRADSSITVTRTVA